jgi:hypothetical protein
MSKKQESVIQSAVTPHIKIVVNSEGADGKITTAEWRVCLDYRALAKIEDATGKDLKRIESWKDISSGKEFPQIIWCCLNRYNPTVTVEDVLDNLNPEAQRLLSDALFELTFPGVREAWEAREKTGATANPNQVTETQSV